MAGHFLEAVLILIAASATAWDYAELGFADVYDADTDTSMWLPPGYSLSSPEQNRVEVSWGEGELKGLGIQTRWKSALGGMTPAVMDKAVGLNPEVSNLVPKNERILKPERLAAFGVDTAEGRVAQFEIRGRDGAMMGCRCYFVLAHGKLYIFALKWPSENKAAEEAAAVIADGLRIGPRPPALTSPAESTEP